MHSYIHFTPSAGLLLENADMKGYSRLQSLDQVSHMMCSIVPYTFRQQGLTTWPPNNIGRYTTTSMNMKHTVIDKVRPPGNTVQQPALPVQFAL
jgi:hypothetical protein